MRTVFAIYVRDLKRILKNPVALVVTLGVAILPSLYAWCNIIANWDPYANTGNIQVAVANEDAGTNSTLVGQFNAGEQTVAKLKTNQQLGWQFVSESQALEGVHSGKYYAAIVLPKDFSKNLIGVISGDETRPTVMYYVNEKKNAIAPKITDSGASTIDKQIDVAFVSSVSDAVAQQVKKTAGQMIDKADTVQRDVVNDLTDTINQLNDTQQRLRDMRTTLDEANNTIDAAKQSNASLDKQITAAIGTASTTNGLLAEVRTQAGSFATSLGTALDNGSTRLASLQITVNTATGNVTSGLNKAQDACDSVSSAMRKANTTAGNTLDTVQQALDASGLDHNSKTYQNLSSQIAAARQQVQTQQQQLDTFASSTTALISSGKSTANALETTVGEKAASGISALTNARANISGTILPNLNNGLDALGTASGSLSGTLEALRNSLNQGNSLLDQLSRTIEQTGNTLDLTQTQIADLVKQLDTTRTDMAALDSSQLFEHLSQALGISPSEISEFMGEPVQLDEKVVYAVENYGSAVTPFYTNLALWVGGFVLVAIYKLEVDRDNKIRAYTPRQGYMGRWLLFVTVGFLQALITTVGDLALGIQCEQPFLFILAGLFESFIYVNIIYALAAAFRHIGKALAVILVIVQIPGAAGMYPIEMMPEFFRELKPFLPFTYGINAMREPIAGLYSNHYWLNMLSLFWYLPVALFIGLVVRKLALNLNRLFDNRLADTDLMVTEHNAGLEEPLRLTVAAQQLAKEYPEMMARQARGFFRLYPRLVRWGFLTLGVLPFAFLLLLFITQLKIAMLSAWIISIIVIDTYLIVVEYLRERYANILGEETMSGAEFRNAILRENLLFHKGMSFHPLHVTGSQSGQSAQNARPEDFADNTDNTGDSNDADSANRAQGGER